MNTPTRLHGALAAVAVAAVTLVGCASNPGGDTASTPGLAAAPTSFVVASTVNTLDPLLSTTIQNDVVGDLLYDPLVDFDSSGTMIPRVATEWTVSDDTTSIDLVLRDDITFSDGTPLTAADVVYSLDRIKTTGVGAASLIPQYASATATDDTHVTIALSAPNAAFIGALAKVYVVNSAVVAQHEGTDNAQSWLAANAAGSGAYTLDSYTQGSVVKLQLNPTYWNPADGRPTTFVIQAFAESAAAATGLRSGTVNMASLPTQDAATFQDDDAYAYTEIPTGGTTYIYFNTQKGLTANPQVREAIIAAYDYTAHIDTILGGHGTLATQISPPQLACPAGLPAPAQDLEHAKELIESAGATGSSLTMLYQPNQADQVAAATLLQSNLKEIGIELTLQTTTFPAYLSSLTSIDTTPDLAIAGEYPRYPDADALMNSMLNSQFVAKGSNKSQYANPAVDALLAQAQATTDPAARCDLYTKVEEAVAADHAVMPIANTTFQYVTTANVTGVAPAPARIVFDPMAIRVK